KQPKMLSEALRQVVAVPPGGYARWQLAAMAGILDAQRRSGQPLEKLIDADLKAPVQALFAHARQLAASADVPAKDRVLAIALLGQEPADLKLLETLLTPQNAAEVQAAALAATGRIADDAAAKLVLARWKQLTPSLQGQALDLLLSRERWQMLLL